MSFTDKTVKFFGKYLAIFEFTFDVLNLLRQILHDKKQQQQ